MQIMMISLGCDKNLVDTEMMMGQLREAGYGFTDDETQADVIVVNSCCFIGDAKQESIDTLIEMGKLKESGNLKGLIVAGCLAQRYSEQIEQELPEVDAIVGTMAIDSIVAAVQSVIKKAEECSASEPKEPKMQTALFLEDKNRSVYGKERILSTGGHYAYLKIAEGCDKNCTYCVIPKVRGTYRSFPIETLIKEAEKLADSGAKELILVAQETSLYGVDLYGKKSLPLLIEKLSEIRKILWIRLLYCYPEEITEEIADCFAKCKKLLPYIDLPIQHASDHILKRMGRRTDKEALVKKIALLREKKPDICIRTTLITGFPGETEEDVNELADFCEQIRFDRLGVFTYSPEEGTPAAQFEDQIDEDEKVSRRNYLMELQQQIAFENAERQKGRVLQVLIEGKVADENAYVGRSYMDAPGIDGLVFVNTGSELMTGDIVPVKITGAYEYDLIGVPENEDESSE
ncbi:MAG: 30S ribosomal protein S12 methylthiotransferase RimO [Lachnospiraceae bacterium]|nr:30S ribosomal protein S12 methylthiotransferase RimO [Lachnospiraceae bacterium]